MQIERDGEAHMILRITREPCYFLYSIYLSLLYTEEEFSLTYLIHLKAYRVVGLR